MYTIDREDIESYYQERREEWEFDHPGLTFPLVLDAKGSTEEVLAEIDLSTHLSREA